MPGQTAQKALRDKTLPTSVASNRELGKAVRFVEDLHKRNPETLFRHIEDNKELVKGLESASKNHFDTNQLDRTTLHSLEAIILEKGRPVLFVKDDKVPVEELSQEWQQRIREHSKEIDKNMLSVGRIEASGHPSAKPGEEFFLGTGFVVSKNLILTNRHVALEIVDYNGEIRPGLKARIDFVEEVNRDPDKEFFITGAIEIGPDFDYALLLVDTTRGELPEPLKLASSAKDVDPVEHEPFVYVAGYPAFDPRNPSDVQNRIFGNVYDVKRFAPGRWTATESDPPYVAYYPQDIALKLDYTTLGGNSGSPVFDLKTNMVIGLHFSGAYLKTNYAVPIWTIIDRIRNAQRIAESQINFSNQFQGGHSMTTTINQPRAVMPRGPVAFDRVSRTAIPVGANQQTMMPRLADIVLSKLIEEKALYMPIEYAIDIAEGGFNPRSITDTIDAISASYVLNHFGRTDLSAYLINQLYSISPDLGATTEGMASSAQYLTQEGPRGGCFAPPRFGEPRNPDRIRPWEPSPYNPNNPRSFYEGSTKKCVAGVVGGATLGAIRGSRLGGAGAAAGAVAGALTGACAGGCFDD